MPGLMAAPAVMASHAGIRQGFGAAPSVFQPRQKSVAFSLEAHDAAKADMDVGHIGIIGAVVGGLTGAAAVRAALGRKRSRMPFRIGRRNAVNATLTPAETHQALVNKGKMITAMSPGRIFYASVMGGAYVGMAGLLSLAMAGNLGPGTAVAVEKFVFAALFPVNLLLVLQTGCQLFTGNTATTAFAYFEGLIGKREVLKSWLISYAGNVVGCGGLAVIAWYTGLLTAGTGELAIKTVIKKCSATFGQTMLKAIMCNWLVCMAVFLSTSASDLTGKMVGIWFPISMFVAIGFEHSVANMFMLPAGLLAGAPLTPFEAITRNLIPATLGNLIAGVFVIGAGFTFSVGKWSKK
eukprot:TRINITY_DN8487_c0_g1_i1.p1 TRINITY_DN8487_c0_g1~~TRINITY_DN8487_c0_g1_i1.p1  ORF type:complete len:351 (-),score=65.01 TRINITY_DN8487_c0_g1_i1:579-1631(-)